MNKGASIMIFATGLLIGSAATWQFAKVKYEKIAQEEIDSVKALYGRKNDIKKTMDDTDTKRIAERAQNKPDISEYMALTRQYTPEEGIVAKKDIPYVITPEQFGELEHYAKISLTYFLDGFLTDEDYQIIENEDHAIGKDSLTHFGEYEDDSVFVRNDRLKCDYEILLDQRNYRDVLQTMPHRVEV